MRRGATLRAGERPLRGLESDSAGQLLETWDYDLFGAREVRSASGALLCDSTLSNSCGSAYGNPLGYTGRPLSSLSGLYDMRARHYDPHLRQWTSPDPLGYADGFDLWGYASADPLNLVDPYGLFGRAQPGTGGNGGGGAEPAPDLGGGFGHLRKKAGRSDDEGLTKKQRKEYNERRLRIYNAGGEFGEEARQAATDIKTAYPPESVTQGQIPELEEALCRAERSFGVGECKDADEAEPARRALAGAEYECEGGSCHEDAKKRAEESGGQHLLVLPPAGSSKIVTNSGAEWADHSLVLDPATGKVWDPTYDRTYESLGDWTDQVVDTDKTGGKPRTYPASTAP